MKRISLFSALASMLLANAAGATALGDYSKSFIRFRSAQCTLAEALGGGAIGNALTLRRRACITDQNRQRAAWLRQQTSNLPLK